MEVAPAVCGDDREERGSDRDEKVSAEPRLAFPNLALDADRSAE
jgi:hypothetical protein